MQKYTNDIMGLKLNSLWLSAASVAPFGIEVLRYGRGRKALEAAQKVLQAPEMDGLDLYSFRAVAKGAVLDVRLDKVNHTLKGGSIIMIFVMLIRSSCIPAELIICPQHSHSHHHNAQWHQHLQCRLLVRHCLG